MGAEDMPTGGHRTNPRLILVEGYFGPDRRHDEQRREARRDVDKIVHAIEPLEPDAGEKEVAEREDQLERAIGAFALAEDRLGEYRMGITDRRNHDRRGADQGQIDELLQPGIPPIV